MNQKEMKAYKDSMIGSSKTVNHLIHRMKIAAEHKESYISSSVVFDQITDADLKELESLGYKIEPLDAETRIWFDFDSSTDLETPKKTRKKTKNQE